MEDQYKMKKEWKLDAYESVKGLKNAYWGINHLYEYALGREYITEEEIESFDEVYRKLANSTLEFKLKDELFEDDK